MRARGEDRGDQRLCWSSLPVGAGEFTHVVNGQQSDQPRIRLAAGRPIAAIGAPLSCGAPIARQYDHAAARADQFGEPLEPRAP